MSEVQEFNDLKDQAKLLGIKVGNKSFETLYAEVQSTLDKPEEKTQDSPSLMEKRKQAYLEAGKLVRVIVTPNQAEKAEYEFEDFIVHSKYLGDVYCNIPMGTEYHIPQCIYDFIKSKMYVKAIKSKDKFGLPSTQLLPMYNVTKLDPLTEEELEDIRKGIAAQGNAK